MRLNWIILATPVQTWSWPQQAKATAYRAFLTMTLRSCTVTNAEVVIYSLPNSVSNVEAKWTNNDNLETWEAEWEFRAIVWGRKTIQHDIYFSLRNGLFNPGISLHFFKPVTSWDTCVWAEIIRSAVDIRKRSIICGLELSTATWTVCGNHVYLVKKIGTSKIAKPMTVTVNNPCRCPLSWWFVDNPPALIAQLFHFRFYWKDAQSHWIFLMSSSIWKGKTTHIWTPPFVTDLLSVGIIRLTGNQL